jgi:hypothetical protein
MILFGPMRQRLLRHCGAILTVAATIAGAGCTRHSAQELIVQIPAGFSGNFSLEMGVKDAPALARRGDAYVLSVTKNGRMSTSTLIKHPRVKFENASDGAVWGLSDSVVNTGDGIPVGERIGFFVGTRKEYEAEESKRNHSRGVSVSPEANAAGA